MFDANNISGRSYARHIKLCCPQVGIKLIYIKPSMPAKYI